MNNKLSELMEDIMIAKSETGLSTVLVGVYLMDTLLPNNKYGFKNQMSVEEFLQAFANAYSEPDSYLYEEDLNIIVINRKYIASGFNLQAVIDELDMVNTAQGYPYALFELGVQENRVTYYKMLKLSRAA